MKEKDYLTPEERIHYIDYTIKSYESVKADGIRLGQHYYNCLSNINRTIADKYNGTAIDPFHRNENIPIWVAVVTTETKEIEFTGKHYGDLVLHHGVLKIVVTDEIFENFNFNAKSDFISATDLLLNLDEINKSEVVNDATIAEVEAVFAAKKLKEFSAILSSMQTMVIGIAVVAGTTEMIIQKDDGGIKTIFVKSLLGLETANYPRNTHRECYFPKGKNLHQMCDDIHAFDEWLTFNDII